MDGSAESALVSRTPPELIVSTPALCTTAAVVPPVLALKRSELTVSGVETVTVPPDGTSTSALATKVEL